MKKILTVIMIAPIIIYIIGSFTYWVANPELSEMQIFIKMLPVFIPAVVIGIITAFVTGNK